MADETPTQDYDAIKAEVAAEPETQAADTPPGVFAVPLGDTTIRIKDLGDWPSSANEDLSAARFVRWASKACYGDDFATVWAPMDPTNKQVAQLMVDYEKVTGFPLGSLLLSLSS